MKDANSVINSGQFLKPQEQEQPYYYRANRMIFKGKLNVQNVAKKVGDQEGRVRTFFGVRERTTLKYGQGTFHCCR